MCRYCRGSLVYVLYMGDTSPYLATFMNEAAFLRLVIVWTLTEVGRYMGVPLSNRQQQVYTSEARGVGTVCKCLLAVNAFVSCCDVPTLFSPLSATVRCLLPGPSLFIQYVPGNNYFPLIITNYAVKVLTSDMTRLEQVLDLKHF